MRTLLSASTVAVAALLLVGGPASADVTVTATVDKEKDVFVDEDIFIDKFVFIDADIVSTPDKAAESLATVNQTNSNNEACSNCAEKVDRIVDSFEDNSGIVTYNQAAGNMNNQGNAVSTAVDFEVEDGEQQNGPDGSGFAEAQAAADQRNTDNHVDAVNLLFRTGLIVRSGNNNSGVLFMNQSPGNLNNQVNELSMAVSFEDEGVALSEAELGQLNVGNEALESRRTTNSPGITKDAVIRASLSGNSGVVGVNQSVGNNANQGNVFAVASVQN